MIRLGIAALAARAAAAADTDGGFLAVNLRPNAAQAAAGGSVEVTDLEVEKDDLTWLKSEGGKASFTASPGRAPLEEAANRTPRQILHEQKDSGGQFMVFRFPLSFSTFDLYWRRFGVDLPKNLDRCGTSGCPILVDFPGSGGSIFSQRAWTQWYAYQDEIENPFILVTMEGSPDALVNAQEILPCNMTESPQKCADESYAGDGFTSWNVLGWGVPTDLSTDIPTDVERNSSLLASCFPAALKPWNSYQCFETHLLRDAQACHKVSADHQKAWQAFAQIPTNCISASGANDWEYVRMVLQAVTEGTLCNGWCGDRTRIYLTGQSMGGMAALQSATLDNTSSWFLGDLQPAAIVACSPGGSRNNDLELKGQVPTLLMQGGLDEIAVPVPWAGHTPDLDPVVNTKPWKAAVAANKTLAQIALQSLPPEAQNIELNDILLMADTRQGGTLLQQYLPLLSQAQMAGFPDRQGRVTGISAGAYMWEPLRTTLQRVVGQDVPMEDLHYWTPAVSKEEAEQILLQCANATSEVRVCVFLGGHTYPFLPPTSFQNNSNLARAFHELLWVDWLRNGTVRRSIDSLSRASA